MRDDRQRVLRFLDQARQAFRRRAIVESILWTLPAFGVWLLISLFFADLLLPSSWLKLAFFSLAGALVLPLGILFGRAWSRSRDHASISRLVEAGWPDLESQLDAARQFSGPLGVAEGESQALALAHVSRVADSLSRRAEGSWLPPRDFARPIRGALLLFSLVAVVGLTFPEKPGAIWGLFHPSVKQEAAQKEERAVEQGPYELLEALEVQLVSPKHTRRLPRTIRYAKAGFSGLKGSVASLNGTLAVEARAVKLMLVDEEGAARALSAEVSGRTFSLKLTLIQSAHFYLSVQTPEGEWLEERVRRPLEVTPDAPPDLTLKLTTQSQLLTPLDKLRFEASAEDDFGLAEVVMHHSIEGLDSYTKPLSKGSGRRYKGEVEIDLAELALAPGDRVAFWLEAKDNNSFPEPNRAETEKITLEISSPEARHDENIRAQEEVRKGLLRLLAEYLERPLLLDEPGQTQADGFADQLATSPEESKRALRRLAEMRERLLEQMREVETALLHDPLLLRRDFELFESLRVRLERLHINAEGAREGWRQEAPGEGVLASYGRAHRIPQVRETERALLLLDELIRAEWLDAAQMTIHRIRETRDRLQNLLRQLKESDDPALKQEILKEISRLERQLGALRARLSEQASSAPRDHLNAGAAKELEGELAATPDTLKELLESGDIDGALSALDQMTSDLEEQLAISEEQPGNHLNAEASAQDKRVSELYDKINDLVAAEAEMVEQSQGLAMEMRARRADALEEAAKRLFEEEGEALEESAKLLQKIEGAGGLSAEDLDALAEVKSARNLAEKSTRMGDAEALMQMSEQLWSKSRRARSRLRTSRALNPLGSQEQAKYDRALDDLDEVISQARRTQNRSAALVDEAKPQPNSMDAVEMAKQAELQRKIIEATNDLGAKIEEVGQNSPSLTKDLEPSLEQAQKEMREGERALERARITEAVESERGALRALHSMKRQLQKSIEDERMGKKQRSSGKRVSIPKEEREGAEELRKQLLEFMKLPGLEAYEEENARYYKALID